jgi:YD repeat-containing protein
LGNVTVADVISNYDYAPHGKIQNALFGNNASTTYFYDTNAAYRLSNLQTIGSGNTSIQKFGYTYDSVGNITQIANTASSSAAATVVYAYDALNRLTSGSTIAASSSPFTKLYTYDALGNITASGSSASSSSSATPPTIMDTIPSSSLMHDAEAVTSESFSYTVPSGGSNKLLMVLFGDNSATGPTSITQNGTDFTSSPYPSDGNLFAWNAKPLDRVPCKPSSGTFSMSWGGTTYSEMAVFTVQNAAQTNLVDAQNLTCGTANTMSSATTTSVGNDLLLSYSSFQSQGSLSSFGSGQSQVTNSSSPGFNSTDYVSWKAAGSTAGSEIMTTNINSSRNIDVTLTAIKPVSFIASTSLSSIYSYGGTGYANPDAPTMIATGYSTTTFTYDNNGNVIQRTTDGTTTTYVYDYANRLIALGAGNATTTYGYDWAGNRVYQTGTTTTYLYPFKWYSVASSTGSGAKYATTTDYVFNGDSLVATMDQQTASGNATGTAKTRYVHPDHLGSTNVVTDENGNVVQTLDFYPYGGTRLSVATSTNEKRQ